MKASSNLKLTEAHGPGPLFEHSSPLEEYYIYIYILHTYKCLQSAQAVHPCDITSIKATHRLIHHLQCQYAACSPGQ